MQAIEIYEESLAIARKVGDRRNEGIWLDNLGLAYYALGRVEQAAELHGQALDIAHQVGHHAGAVDRLRHLGHVHYALGQIQQAIGLHQKAMAIAQEIDNPEGRGHQLLELGKLFLVIGELSEAKRCCTESLALSMPEFSYSAALALGIVLLHQRDSAAGETFADAASRCRAMLGKTPGLYEPRYVLAAALVGQAVCDLNWKEENERAELLAPALAEYRRVLEITSAPGVVQDALQDMELISTAGIEGLEPVFELLEGAKARHEH